MEEVDSVLHRMLIFLLMVVTVFSFSWAAVADAPYAGHCENGKPVITRWDPALDQYFRPACSGDKLILQQKDIVSNRPQPTEPRKLPDRPQDWGRWVGIWLNKKAMVNPYDDVEPYVVASTGRTLIPIRMVTEAMGGTATWDEATRKVTIRLGDRYMEMTIDKTEAVANGQPIKLDQPPLIWMNRTMVPLRVVVEAFGAEVKWSDEVDRVDITLPSVECAPGYCVDWL
jgi:hypothetical protein